MNLHRSMVVLVVGAVFSGAVAHANGVLVGNGSLFHPNDLTRIRVGSDIVEFLDLTSTAGLSVASALAAYAGSGFHWANGNDMAELVSAFGMSYSINPGGISADLGGSEAQRTSFVSYLGTPGIKDYTNNTGWLDDHSTQTMHSYLCVGFVGCGKVNGGGGAFVAQTSQVWPAGPYFGVYLVRTAPPVPESSTLSMLLPGLAAILGTRRLRDQVHGGRGAVS